MGPEVSLRPARPDDAPALAQVHWDSWVAAYRDVLPQASFDELPLARRERTWRRAAERMQLEPAARTGLTLAESAGRVLGFASRGPLRITGNGTGDGGAGDGGVTPRTDDVIGELYAIYLAPDAFRRGIGRALFEDSRAALREAGFASMRLWVLAPNRAAIAFYEAMGGTRHESSTFTTHGVTIEEYCYHCEP